MAQKKEAVRHRFKERRSIYGEESQHEDDDGHSAAEPDGGSGRTQDEYQKVFCPARTSLQRLSPGKAGHALPNGKRVGAEGERDSTGASSTEP
jgi:hypothetical protein